MAEAAFQRLQDGQYRIVGDLSFATVPALMEAASELFAQDKTVSLALDEVERVDSAGLALLVSLLRQARQSECELSLTGVSEQLLGLARVGGVECILPLKS